MTSPKCPCVGGSLIVNKIHFRLQQEATWAFRRKLKIKVIDHRAEFPGDNSKMAHLLQGHKRRLFFWSRPLMMSLDFLWFPPPPTKYPIPGLDRWLIEATPHNEENAKGFCQLSEKRLPLPQHPLDFLSCALVLYSYCHCTHRDSYVFVIGWRTKQCVFWSNVVWQDIS